MPHDPAARDLLIVAATETNTDEDFAALEVALDKGAGMSMNNQGRPSQPGAAQRNELPTISGDRGLDHEERLIFETRARRRHGRRSSRCARSPTTRLGGLRRKGAIGLPGLSEPEVIRHYVRLSRQNYAIDAGLYPLGSCTMKHNPRLNEKMARLPGFGDLHPLAPRATTQGALAADLRTDELADHAHRHAGRGHVAQGGRAWRIVRPAGDPRRRRGAGRNAHRASWCRNPRMAPIPPPPPSPASRWTKCRPSPMAMSMPMR